MADIETKIILKVDSTEAVENIKDLKENVEICKDTLLKLQAGTKEYNETLQTLAQSQEKINEINGVAETALQNLAEATSGLKEDAESYMDGLSNLQTGTEEYIEVLSNLAESQEGVNEANTEAESALANLIERTSELRDAIEEYIDELFILYIGTEEYIEVLMDLAESQDSVNEVNTEADFALQNLIERIAELRDEVESYIEELFILYTGTEEYIEVLMDLTEWQDIVNEVNGDADFALQNLIERIADLRGEVESFVNQLSILYAGTEEYIELLFDLTGSLESVNAANADAETILLNLIGGISEMRGEVESYDDGLSIVYISTVEYIEVLLDLAESQERVNEVNEDADVALLNLIDEISELIVNLIDYNEELSNLRIETEEHNEALLNLIETQEMLNEAHEEAYAELQNLLEELGKLIAELEEYNEELSNARIGTEEYDQALQDLTESQKDANRLTEILKKTTENATEAYNQLKSASEKVVQGLGDLSKLTEMLGGDNEFLAETLGKVQAGLALTQQLSAVMKSTKAANIAFKLFNTTLYANPILAVAAAAAILVAGLAVLFTALGKNKKQTEQLNKAQENYNKKIEETNQQHDRDLKLAIARGAESEELIELEKQHIQAKKEQTKALIAQYESYKKLNKEQKENLENLKKELEALDKADYDLETRREEERLKKEREEREKEEARKKEEAEREQQRIEEENARKLAAQQDFLEKEREAAESHKERLEEIRKEEQRRLLESSTDEERLKLLQEEIERNESLQASLLEAANNEKLSWQDREKAARDYQQALIDSQALTADLALVKQEIADKEKEEDDRKRDELERLRELEEEKLLIAKEQEEQKILANASERERYEYQLAQSEEELKRHNEELGRLATELENEKLTNDERIALLEEYNQALEKQAALKQKVADATEELSEHDIKVKEENHKATIDFLNDSASKLGENTIAGKALGIASATISTYTGAAQVLADPTTPNPFVKWASFAATIATGLSAVKNILSTDVPGTADTVSADTSASSIPLPSLPEMSSDFVETHNNIDAYDEDIFNQQPVLVVEDVNNVQKRVRVAEGEATF